jgi:hypothetical protein
MRTAAAALSAALLLGGCAFEPDEELEAHMTRIAPAQAELVECGWQKTWGSGDDENSYECTFGAPGDVVSVGDELLVHAGLEGFTVWCDGARHRLGIAGVNGKKVVRIEVLERGFTGARTVDISTRIPRGHVLVSISVEKRESPQPVGGRRCLPSNV